MRGVIVSEGLVGEEEEEEAVTLPSAASKKKSVNKTTTRPVRRDTDSHQDYDRLLEQHLSAHGPAPYLFPHDKY